MRSGSASFAELPESHMDDDCEMVEGTFRSANTSKNSFQRTSFVKDSPKKLDTSLGKFLGNFPNDGITGEFSRNDYPHSVKLNQV